MPAAVLPSRLVLAEALASRELTSLDLAAEFATEGVAL
jgi:hypothetical protein